MWDNPNTNKEKAPAVPNILCAGIDIYMTEKTRWPDKQPFVRQVKKASKMIDNFKFNLSRFIFGRLASGSTALRLM
jgi:hypothetical protein